MKGSRRKAREEALQILYQLDLNHDLNALTALQHFEKLYARGTQGIDAYVNDLVMGVSERLKEIDERILAVSEHWRPERMAAVDRNILRLGVYELCYRDDVPTTVTLNEMVEIAKDFGAENTPAFVNGILDKVKSNIQNPNKAK